jgi:predicted transcriptional regulator
LMKEIVEESGLSQATIAEKAGYKRASNVSEYLSNNNMRVDNMVRI